MSTSIEQAVKDHKTPQGVVPAARADTILTAPAANNNDVIANDNAAAGSDGMDFVRANRIHVEHGSLFVDPYLVVHPRELDPKNETQLREKLRLTYSINNPSFYEAPERVATALNLGQLVPVSLGAKRSKLLDEVKKFNGQVDSGADAGLVQQAGDKRAPFSAIVRDTLENPEVDPVGIELLKNGLSIYLLLREKLTQNHFLKPLTDYVERSNTPDQVLHDLADNIGVTPQQVREAALKGGVEGVGELLGLAPAYVADVKKLSDYASQHDFGYNMIEHWHLGRQLNGIEAPLPQKLQTGMNARIDAKIGEYRGRVRHYYDVPDPTKIEEERIAKEDMSVLEPIQRKLMFALGYEICHTPENTADTIAFHKGVYGLHRKAANDLSDIDGTYRIYYGGHGSREKSVGTLAHEVAHNFWPSYFSKEQVADIDRLAGSDADRFNKLQRLMDKDFDAFEKLLGAYHAGNPEEKKAVLATANEQLSAYGVKFDDLFPFLVDAKSFRFMVWDAGDVLHVEGGRYNRSGYDTPQERFREVVSRFAEMRQVSHRDQPAVMRFIAPGLTQVWEQQYIPHLERVYADVQAHKSNPKAPTNARHADLAATADEPKVEEKVKPTGTPVGHTQADSSSAPRNEVLANTVALNPNTLAGLDALKGMHISH